MRLREPCQTYSCSLLTPCHFPGPPPFLLKQPLWGAANHHKLAWHSISTTLASSSNIIGNHEVIAAGYHYDEYWSKKMDRSKQCLWNPGTARIWCSKTPSHNFFGLRRSKWDWIMRIDKHQNDTRTTTMISPPHTQSNYHTLSIIHWRTTCYITRQAVIHTTSTSISRWNKHQKHKQQTGSRPFTQWLKGWNHQQMSGKNGNNIEHHQIFYRNIMVQTWYGVWSSHHEMPFIHISCAISIHLLMEAWPINGQKNHPYLP